MFKNNFGKKKKKSEYLMTRPVENLDDYGRFSYPN